VGVQERKEREREQRRRDILDAARAVFVEHGLAHASMDRIADHAELAKGTLYLYFRNRDELLMALIADDMEQLIAKLESVSSGRLRSDRKLLKAVETFYEFAVENNLFYQVMTQVNVQQLIACNQESSAAMGHFEEHNTRMMSAMTAILREGVATGVFKLEHSEEYTVLLMVMAIKGTVVIKSNGMLPPAWMEKDLKDLLHDQAVLFINGLAA